MIIQWFRSISWEETFKRKLDDFGNSICIYAGWESIFLAERTPLKHNAWRCSNFKWKRLFLPHKLVRFFSPNYFYWKLFDIFQLCQSFGVRVHWDFAGFRPGQLPQTPHALENSIMESALGSICVITVFILVNNKTCIMAPDIVEKGLLGENKYLAMVQYKKKPS